MKEKLKHMSIEKKLLYSHGSIIVSTFVLILGLFAGTLFIESRLVKMYEGPTANIEKSAGLYYTQIDIQRVINRMMVEGPDNFDTLWPQVEATVKDNLEIMDEAYLFLKGNLITKEDVNRLEEIQRKLDKEATSHRTEVMSLLKQKNFEQAREYNNRYYKPKIII